MKKTLLEEYNHALKNKGIFEYKDIFKNIYNEMQVEEFSPKEKIIFFNKTVDKLFYLTDGKAKINMVHEDGKSSIVQFLQSGDFIGELTLIGVEKQPKDVIAISKCVCITIPLAKARKELLRNEQFLLYLNKYLGGKLLKRTEFFARNQSYELKNRLAAYILLTESDGIYNEKHTETAEFLGISYRHLLFTLKKFQEQGLLFKLKKGYKIDKRKLLILAKDVYQE